MTITTTKYAAGSPSFYAIGQVKHPKDGKPVLYTAIESTRLGAFMAVAWQLAVAGYIKKGYECDAERDICTDPSHT